MATLRESGHYAIAGFLYQLIGSGVQAFQLLDGRQNNGEPSEVLLLECLGQDAAVLPSDGSGSKPKLIQYKYSTTGEIAPFDLRKILQSLSKSIRDLGMDVHQVEYKLVTNRRYSPKAEEWVAAKENHERLQQLIRSSCRTEIDEVPQLASIFQSLEYHQTSSAELREELLKTGSSFGMLDDEVRAGIDELIGLLMRRASESGRRIVRHRDIHKAFTGCETPLTLLSPESVRIRHDKVDQYKHDETRGQPTIPRLVSADIAQSILVHPVTVVIGDGGTGKTVAACDAVAIGLAELNTPPGFGLILRAFDVNHEAIKQTVAEWRNLAHHSDGQAWKRSISRLRGAFADNPLLVICIDAIDEKSGNARLPEDAQRFIREVIQDALEEHEAAGAPVTSIILTCRRFEELDNILRGGFSFEYPHNQICVLDFEDDEIELLAASLDRDVTNRIIERFPVRAARAVNVPSRAMRPVSAATLATIRHPVLWRFFSTLDPPTQHACLDGSTEGLDQLAEKYLDWFRKKVEMRITGLLRNECVTALVNVASQFHDNPAKVGQRNNDWLIPCDSAGCSRLHAIQIMEEALTSGILVQVEEDGRRWRWRHIWFCEYLFRSGVNGT
jgi:hypothetical protein